MIQCPKSAEITLRKPCALPAVLSVTMTLAHGASPAKFILWSKICQPDVGLSARFCKCDEGGILALCFRNLFICFFKISIY